jgi:molybdenum cofactor cytidylyltransferase
MTRMVPGLVLAAGAATRMGRSKALLPTGVAGETFLSRTIATLRAAGVDDVVVVIASDADDVRRAVAALPGLARVAENPHPGNGQLSSMLAGLNLVDRPGVVALLVTLVDAPFVSPDTVRALLDAYRRTHAPVVRPARAGRHGHPVIFDRRVFQELRHADPALGAKAVVRAHAGEVLDVEVADDGAFQDIDTPEDYERVTGRRLPGGA